VSELRVKSASAGRRWTDWWSGMHNRARARFAIRAGSWEGGDLIPLMSFAGFGGLRW
jgi:hypothetical protein